MQLCLKLLRRRQAFCGGNKPFACRYSRFLAASQGTCAPVHARYPIGPDL